MPLISSDIPEKNPFEVGLKLISILRHNCLSAHLYSFHWKLTIVDYYKIIAECNVPRRPATFCIILKTS